ncbi:family 78 glycoside hydrolase catalytic domain [Quadrisphaera sp. KR29]|uniref:family 78 glycoside hydrolase catalytic domain n=1 Tax=Quadrisphaera sp. KR29 TaxID=3461391 RepID=UPI0040446EBA
MTTDQAATTPGPSALQAGAPQAVAPRAKAPRVLALRVEHQRPGEALGTGEASPRLSWQVAPGPRDWVQARYELRLVDDRGAATATADPVESPDQVLVPWPFAPLASRQRVLVQVRTTGADGATSPWSAPEPVEAGLLHREDWSAVPVTADPAGEPGAPVPSPAPRVRRAFTVRAGLVRARLHLTALGLVEAHVNGRRVGDELLAPGWTAYRARLRYRTHDVTGLLVEGENAVGALLGNGWWRGRLAWGGRRALYGTQRALLAQLELTYADGAVERVVTDGSWRTSPGEVLEDDLYDGEHVDQRLRDSSWLRPGFDDSTWAPVTELPLPAAELVAADSAPVRAVRTVRPTGVRVLDAPGTGAEPGQTTVRVDLGENVVGHLRVRVRPQLGAQEGDRVVVRQAEVLEHGALGVRPLRTARATDTYDLAGAARDGGTGEQVLEPRFTFHGFRYAEVSGPAWVARLTADDVEGVVITSDLEPAGGFSCSEPLLGQLHANVLRGWQGNAVDVPTDCPQRDERLGWTGDAQVFSPTASFLTRSGGFWTSWLKDVAAEQVDGAVPFVVPDVLSGPGVFGSDGAPVPAAAWGDAGVVVPWVVFERTGDTGVLARQWPSMVAWVERLLREAGEDLLWSGGFQFGDWLDPTAPPDDAAAAQADPDVIATAHLARGADLLARTARVLGRDDDAAHWSGVAQRVREAFVAEYVTGAGRVLSDCPTVYAVAICWDLLPPSARQHAGDRLADLVRTSGFRISTGFVGTPLVTDALTLTGHVEVAHRLLLQRRVPSWLYPVTMGATTVWERWDSMLPDGTINPGEMTSFNHYALGAVADWMHRTLAGLAPAADPAADPGSAGYRELVVAPRPGGGLTRASAWHDTPYGRAEVAWRVEGGTWHLHVVVPPGARALVHLPDGSAPVRTGSGEHAFSLPLAAALGAVSAPVGLDSSVRDLLDDARAWDAVAPALVGAGVGEDDGEAARRIAPLLERSVRAMALSASAPGSVPAGTPLLQAVERALEEVAASSS